MQELRKTDPAQYDKIAAESRKASADYTREFSQFDEETIAAVDKFRADHEPELSGQRGGAGRRAADRRPARGVLREEEGRGEALSVQTGGEEVFMRSRHMRPASRSSLTLRALSAAGRGTGIQAADVDLFGQRKPAPRPPTVDWNSAAGRRSDRRRRAVRRLRHDADAGRSDDRSEDARRARGHNVDHTVRAVRPTMLSGRARAALKRCAGP